MQGEVVQRIADLARGQTQKHRVGEQDFLVRDGAVIASAIVERPAPATLTVHTLTGLVDYVRENRDEVDLAKTAVHVVSPTRVDLLSATDPITQQRFTHMTAACYDRFAAHPSFRFGAFLDHEVMVVALMALFEESPDQSALLSLLSNVQQVASRTDDDDLISQVATVRHGISMAAERRIPNPVTLAPHRSFVEIEQPASKFVFRMKPSDEGQKSAAALFEADGGAWRDRATFLIRGWLEQELPEGVAILA